MIIQTSKKFYLYDPLSNNHKSAIMVFNISVVKLGYKDNSAVKTVG